MKKNHFAIIFILFFTYVHSQHIVYENFSLNNPTKIEIVKLISDYINNKTSASEVFTKYDKETFKTIDITKEALSLNGSLYQINSDANILSIKKEGDNYIAQVMLYWHTKEKEEDRISVLGIVNLWIKKENDSWKISNYLNYYSSNWSSTTVGNIKYIYYPEFPFDIHKAEEALNFYKILSDYFNIKNPDNLTYYITKNCDDIRKISGFEYFISDGNNDNICGFFDDKNNIIYTTVSFDEIHLHEIIHTINKHFPNCNSTILTGVSSYINDAGSRGANFMYHIKKFKEFIKTNNVDFENFYDIENVDEYTNAGYVIGATLCNAIYRKGGKKLLLEFMINTKDNNSLKAKIKKEFNIKDFKTFFINEMDIYLKQGKSLLYFETLFSDKTK